MIPTNHSMMVMGLVSCRGMWTGQILQGAAPAAAFRYQIVILFMIASATALGVFACGPWPTGGSQRRPSNWRSIRLNQC